MANFAEHQLIMKLLDTADCLIRELLRRDLIQNKSVRGDMLDAQYHISEAIDSLNQVQGENERQNP